MSLGFGIHRDLDAVTGDVRMALVDGDCPLRNNSNNTVTYRVDGLALCQRIPIITGTPDSHAVLSTLTGTSSPHLSVQLFLDASPSPVCTVTSDATGAWSCGGLRLADGSHTAVATGIVFASSTGDLLPESLPVLQSLLESLQARPWIHRLRIEGHTDDRGNAEANRALSQRRAESVRQWLVGHGIAAKRLEAEGYGSTRPIADNATAEGRTANRRVEFIILEQAGAPAPSPSPTPPPP